jgi:hypothetical protein
VDQKPSTNGAGWKWIAGGLALLVSYQLGYSSGSTRVSAPLNSSASYLDPSLGNSSMTMDTNMTMDTPPIVTATAPIPEELNNATEGPLSSDTSTARIPAPEPAGATATSRERLANINLSDDDGEYADTETGGASAPSSSTPAYPTPTYSAPSYAPPPRVGCAENGTCYGDVSSTTGLPKTTYVHGYTRRDGTYVRSHYRSHR